MTGKSKKKTKDKGSKKVKSYSLDAMNEMLEEFKKSVISSRTMEQQKELENKASAETEKNEGEEEGEEEEREDDEDESDESSHCGHCRMYVESGVFCDYCKQWYHFDDECSGISDAQKIIPEHKQILYICINCQREKENHEKESRNARQKSQSGSMNNWKLQEIQEQIITLHEVMNSLVTGLYDQIRDLKVKGNNEETDESKRVKTYAEKLKMKNTLVIKSNDGENKANQKKKAIMSKIKTQVDEVRETKDGHLIVNFTNKEKLDEAKKEFEENKDEMNLTVSEKEKLNPKIKVCNVHKDTDDVIEVIKLKNDWIIPYIRHEEDFKLVQKLKTTDDESQHCIIKCTPEIRREICARNNILYTLYKSNKVYDSYKVYQCFKCQEFNHSAKNCTKSQVCAKCGGNHRLVECNLNVEKCINCERKGYHDLNHRTNGTKCPIYKEELSRIRNRTDHGF